jgi:hypothetical protein
MATSSIRISLPPRADHRAPFGERLCDLRLDARVVSEPLAPFIRYEYEITSGLNIAAGEEVRWLPRRRVLGGRHGYPDRG